jgi:hypothetical protein
MYRDQWGIVFRQGAMQSLSRAPIARRNAAALEVRERRRRRSSNAQDECNGECNTHAPFV